jgi:3-oxoacyl-[acyl-carrier-protein] synthase III
MHPTITGVGKAVPDRVVTNEELSPQVGVSAEWIETRTGILERRYASNEDSASSLGTRAGREALAVAKVDPSEISTIITATCTPDYLLPATSNIIQKALGAKNAASFDLAAACSGFVYSLSVAASLVASGASKRVLIVGVDLLSRHCDFSDPLTAPLFGDGAAAVVVEATDSAEPMKFELGSDGGGLPQVLIPGGGSKLPEDGLPHDPSRLLLKMAGREVFRNAVRVMSDLGNRFGKDSFDILVAHQANRRILYECADQMGVSRDKVYLNIQRYGNTSAASIPLALCEAWEEGKLTAGHRVLMLAFGAGYTWGAAAMRWTLGAPATTSSEEPKDELAHQPA